MIKGPDFLGIGAQRSGTSWLERSFKDHPEIWTAPVKEIHYFDIIRKEAELHDRRWHIYKSLLRYRFLRTGADIIKLRYDIRDLLWDMRFFLSPSRGKDKWYISLFSNQKVSGEITPAYAVLPEETIAEIANMRTDLKIIFIMRNPIARSWSSTANYCKNNNIDLSALNSEEVNEIVHLPSKQARSDYPQTIKKWEKYFPKEQIFYAFFEEIANQPHHLLKRLCGFLGVNDDDGLLKSIISKPVNSTQYSKIPIPEFIRDELINTHMAKIEWLQSHFPDSPYPKQWLKDAKS